VRNLMLGSRQTRPLGRGRVVLGLAALLGLGACATSARPLPLGSVIEQARQECARLRESTLSRPVQTPVDARLAELDQMLAAGQSDAALDRARTLSSACSAEAEQRSGLVVLSADVEAIRSRVGTRRYGQYRWLAEHGDYSSAIFCGQALLKGDPGGCEGAPVAAAPLAEASRTPSVAPAPPAGGRAVSHAVSHDWDATEGDDETSTAAASGAGSSPTPAATLRRRATPAPSRTASWVAFGTSAAALVAGGVLAGLATQRRADLADRCPDCSRAEIDGGKQLALGADLAFGVGLTAALTGLVLWWVGPGAEARAPAGAAAAGAAAVGRAEPRQRLAPRLDLTARSVRASWAF